jgi:hypothetical protein
MRSTRVAAALLLASLVLVVLVAAPALAKDPFEPLVTTQTGDTSTTTTTTDTTAGQPAVIGVPEDATSESLPTTGSDVSGWLVIAYGLVVAGGAALVVGRMLHPTALRRVRSS